MKLKKLIIGSTLVLALPMNTAAAGQNLYSAGNVNIRSKPDTQSKIIGVLGYNAECIVLEDADEFGWTKIKSGNVTGYIASHYFSEEPLQEGYKVAQVTAEALNIRQTKNSNSNVIKVVEQNKEVEVVDYNGGAWVDVITDDGKYGYINADYATIKVYYPTAQELSETYVAPQTMTTPVKEEFTTESEYYDCNCEEDYEYNYNVEEDYYNYETEFPTNDNDYNYETEVTYEDYNYETEISDYDETEPSYNYEPEPEVEYEEDYYDADVDYDESYDADEEYYEDEYYEADDEYYDADSGEYYEEEETTNYGLDRSSVAGIASQFIGYPYVYGASGPNSFDCSGLTSYCYAQIGISIPRTAADQYYGCTQIPVEQAVYTPGALIFYHGLGHVAISNGDGTVTHASNSTTGVIVSNAYYSTPDGAGIY